jgi:hypothetical protein
MTAWGEQRTAWWQSIAVALHPENPRAVAIPTALTLAHPNNCQPMTLDQQVALNQFGITVPNNARPRFSKEESRWMLRQLHLALRSPAEPAPTQSSTLQKNVGAADSASWTFIRPSRAEKWIAARPVGPASNPHHLEFFSPPGSPRPYVYYQQDLQRMHPTPRILATPEDIPVAWKPAVQRLLREFSRIPTIKPVSNPFSSL